MSAATTNSGKTSRFGAFGPWMIIALVATVAGVVLPQIMPSEGNLPVAAVKSDSKEKGSLEYKAPALPEPPNFQAMMLRLGGGTVVVLVMCVGAIWTMRRWMNPAIALGSGERAMQLIETLPLGNRCCLHLVRLGKREVLVGADGTGVKSIVPLAEPFAEVLAEAEQEPEPAQGPRLAA